MAQVNVIDSIVITQENDKTKVIAEWSAVDPEITVYGELTSAQAIKLFLDWSDQNGTIALQTGDYFTFVIPDIFRQDNIKNVTDAAIKTPLGEVLATYSIYDNDGQKKEVKITFTDYVETHTDISGNLWLMLFVGRIDTTEEKTIEFVVNGDLAASGEVTINPEPSYNRIPKDRKFGKSVLVDIYNGYYIFNWTVYINMEEDTVNGFHTLENFSFEDVIPEDSPHVFLTEEIRQQLGLTSNQFPIRVGEYEQADSYFPGDRYPFFKYQYNGSGDTLWFLNYVHLANGYTTIGIDGASGLNVSDFVVTEKSLSAKLGRLTRPTGVQYCTMATVKIAESALGDSEVVKLFENTFKVSHGDDLTVFLDIYIFKSGGEGQGITGDYDFEFTKVNESGAALPKAEFSLFISDDFSKGADRVVYSDGNGVVLFKNLPEETFYLKETAAPDGYAPNSTVYKVVISRTGFEIYYGDNFENKLSDYDNKIVNVLEARHCSVILTGTKSLTGLPMSSGMFSFVVTDNAGGLAATGTNAANGDITFSEIKFDSPGEYTFTVEEITGTYSGITYDGSKYTVTVTVTENGSGKLKAHVAYPDGGIVFNNTYAAADVSVILTGTKSLTGLPMSSGMFSFVVTDNAGGLAATGTNAANGDITFSEIKFDSPGEYTFTIEETAGTYSGITYDSSKYTVTVTVTENGSGKLKAHVAYPDGGIVFNNTYATSDVSVMLTGTKSLKGLPMSVGMFSFVVRDNDGATAATGTNTANGGITFSEIKFDSPGEYTFTIEETAGTYSGITYDGSKYTVTVTVTNDGSGNLKANVAYPDGGIVFNNSYAKIPVKPCQCYARSTKCRKTIEGQKIWIDNDNADGTRPASVKIILMRDGEIYKSIDIDSAGDGVFVFCCVPIGKRPGHKYDYQIDEANVPLNYTKTIEGYNVINTLIR